MISLVQSPSGTPLDQTYGFTYAPASGIGSRAASNDNYAFATFGVGTTAYGAANGLNQYPTVAAATCGYDNRENLTSDGVRTMTYDVESRLLSLDGGRGCACMTYDPLGRLRQTAAGATVTQFLYAGDQLVGGCNNAGVQLRALRRTA